MTSERSDASLVRTVVLAGLIAGTLDLTAALVIGTWRGTAAIQIVQSIASGLLSRAAYTGGAATAALGVVMHYAIATGWAALFVLLARRWRSLVANVPVSALISGMFVWGMMNFVVLPLSAFPHELVRTVDRVAISAGVIVCCVGLPIVVVTRWGMRRGRRSRFYGPARDGSMTL